MPVRGPWIGGHEGWFYVVGDGDPERREKPRMVTLNVLPVGEYIETRLASQTQSVGRSVGWCTYGLVECLFSLPQSIHAQFNGKYRAERRRRRELDRDDGIHEVYNCVR